jgi:hypothetical protein
MEEEYYHPEDPHWQLTEATADVYTVASHFWSLFPSAELESLMKLSKKAWDMAREVEHKEREKMKA